MLGSINPAAHTEPRAPRPTRFQPWSGFRHVNLSGMPTKRRIASLAGPGGRHPEEAPSYADDPNVWCNYQMKMSQASGRPLPDSYQERCVSAWIPKPRGPVTEDDIIAIGDGGPAPSVAPAPPSAAPASPSTSLLPWLAAAAVALIILK